MVSQLERDQDEDARAVLRAVGRRLSRADDRQWEVAELVGYARMMLALVEEHVRGPKEQKPCSE